MSRVTTDQAIKITNSNSNRAEYFALKNDGDKCKVRFMYNKISDIETFALHDVEVNGFNRHVDCLKDAEGNGVCPFCEKGVRKVARTFFKLYCVDDGVVRVWDCGVKRAPLIENLLKNACDGDIVNYVFEIQRKGKANDTSTSYDFNKIGKDEITLDDLPTAPDLYSRFILKKTPEEMEYYITNNEFPKQQKEESSDKSTEVKKRSNRMVF